MVINETDLEGFGYYSDEEIEQDVGLDVFLEGVRAVVAIRVVGRPSGQPPAAVRASSRLATSIA